MLNLVTAVPASGKTLFVIHLLKDVKDRPIYYHGIIDLKLPWTKLVDPKNWPNEVPDGSIVVIDEVQEVFPVRDHKKPKPLGVEALEKHRHRGIDLYFITQHPSMLDIHVRRLTGCHRHLSRKFGFERSTLYTGNEYFDPSDYHAKKTTAMTSFKFPKSSYGLYKSAEKHTHKKHIPKILYFIPVGLAIVFYSLYSIFDILTGDDDIDSLTSDSGFLVSAMPNASTEITQIKSSDFVETIAGVPASAPVYASLWQPQVTPVLSCVSSDTRCQCYTEQGTRYFIDDKLCRKRVKFGFYDFTKENKTTNSTNSNTNQRSFVSNDNKKPSNTFMLNSTNSSKL